MPQMVLSRNFVLVSTFGHTIAFEKDVPVGVPPKLVPKAMEIGAVLVDAAKKEEFLPAEPKPAVEAPDGDARETAVFEAFRQLIEKNDTNDFNAACKPKFKAVSAVTGFRVDAHEVAEMWGKYNEFLAALKNGTK